MVRLGVKTRTFHLSDYRRATLGPGIEAPADYFYKDPSPPSQLLRQRILKKCREDIFKFLWVYAMPSMSATSLIISQ